ncbi:MAG: Ribosomal RNA small subunit methyltransferase D [Chlamydiae bacterium]|nr:Ribosomal RNA small subunit methyltransferase D [Chlamydiota bacterium]
MRIIGGEYRGRKLVAPKTDKTRPSKSILRESLFNICAPYIEETVFLDLFAGSGAIGFEALSRGAKQVLFVENQKTAIEAIKKNAALLNVENQITIIPKNVYHFLTKVPSFCDIIFADPPYCPNEPAPPSYKLFEILDSSPILNPKGRFFLETHRKENPYPNKLSTLEFFKKRQIGNSQLLEYKAC